MIEPLPPGLLPRAALAAEERNEMFALLSRHFEGVTRGQFERDLAEKNWVVEIRRDGRLLGFSTMLVCEERHEGRALTAIYSGDTIVAPEAWRSPALARAWIAAVNWIKEGRFETALCQRSLRAAGSPGVASGEVLQNFTGDPRQPVSLLDAARSDGIESAVSNRPSLRCHWLLLTSGFRTYRFLPVFWRKFFPRHDAQTPAGEQRLLNHLARARYGENYDTQAGIVRFPHPQMLRGSLGETPAGRSSDEHVAFFLARNPGHAAGDELACITEISDANLTPAGRRMVAR